MAIARDGTYYRACNLCEAICGLAIVVEGGRPTSVRGDERDPLSHGHICPKGNALLDLHADADRLRRPVRRVDDRWEELAWDAALDLVAERLADVARRDGDDAIAIYQGNPSVHNSGTLLGAGGFLRALRTKNRFSATSVDQLPHHRAALEMFGHPLLLPIPDVDRTEFFLIVGANPLASNGSIMTAPGIGARMRAIRARGGRIVTIDPRRTETARASDEHHFIRPGSDAFFLLALAHVVFAEGLADCGRLAPVVDGLDALRDACAPYAPETVARATGISAATIRDLARAFARAPRGVVYGRIGVSTQPFGGLCQWLINALNAITANLDEPGGAMWPTPALDLLANAEPGAAHAGRYRSRVRGLAEFQGEFPVATMVDEMTVEGPGRVRALVTVAGNPVLSTPDGTALDTALRDLAFYVAIDPYVNETTRHAHVILPPATGFETDHYDAIFHHFAVRNTARYNEAIVPLDEDQRFDWQIFDGLRRRLTGSGGTSPRERIDAGLRAGPYATSIDDLRTHPHGVDFGPMVSVMPQRLLSADGRIDLAPAAMLADLARLRRALAAPVPPLVLVGRRDLRGNNSWMHNAPRLMRGADRCTLVLHPDDAAARGIAPGDRVVVRSRTGSIEVPVEIASDVMPGVASLPHGYGHARAGVRAPVAVASPGASLNDLTDRDRLDELTGNAALSGIAIEVARVAPRSRAIGSPVPA